MLWFTLIFLVLQAIIQSVHLSSNSYIECTAKTLPPNPLKACSAGVSDNLTKCLEKTIYDSGNLADQIVVRNINLKNLNKAFKYVCSNLDIMTLDRRCLQATSVCFLPNLQMRLICLNVIPCLFKTISSSCNPKVSMILSKALKMIKSTACTLSNDRYKLAPFYGPEMHCYPKIPESSENATTTLGPNYENFCTEFKKEKLLKCIKNELTKKSTFLLDDDYIQEAEEFFKQRSELCDYFSNSESKTCPSVDIKLCQMDLFKKEAIQKPFGVLFRSYVDCVYNRYKTCDTTLAQVIKYNLDGSRSIGTHFQSVSFVLIVSPIAIILSLFF